jgi:heme/copper-type cytochrome/quinol oxidase subunit 2
MSLLVPGILYILGLWWCFEVIRRFGQDIQEIREQKEFTRKAVIIFIWALTVIIVIFLVRYSFKIIDEIRDWFF